MRYRLINENEVVGFRWETGLETVYSEDGNAWRTNPIDHECVEPSTGFKDQSGQALYWGDIVLLRDPTTKSTSHFTLIGQEGSQIRLANLQTRSLELLAPQSPIARRLGTRVGRIGEWHLTSEMREQLDALQPLPSDLPSAVLWRVILCLVLGIFVGAGIQWSILNTVGPVSTCLAASALLGCFLGFSHKRSGWLSRSRLLRLSGLTAIVLFGLSFASSWVLASECTLPLAFAYGASGAVLGGTLTLLTGDIISWLVGGYGGELPKGKWNQLYP